MKFALGSRVKVARDVTMGKVHSEDLGRTGVVRRSDDNTTDVLLDGHAVVTWFWTKELEEA